MHNELDQSYKNGYDANYRSEKVEHVQDPTQNGQFAVLDEPIFPIEEKDQSRPIKNPTFEAHLDPTFTAARNSYRQDEQFLESWVSGKSRHTKRGYMRAGEEILSFLHPQTLRDSTLQHLQNFIDSRTYKKQGTKIQKVAALKSLFSFGVKTGYLTVNTAVFLPKIKTHSHLNERYLTEEEVMRMINLTQDLRDRTITKVLYSGGLRISELLGLNWEHLQPRENGTGQITILGKGNKKRVVVLSQGVFQELLSLKPEPARPHHPVFRSREEENPRLSPRSVQVIVDNARLRAGILKKVSPHWLRHAHASHSLDRGAPIHLVQSTLGHASVATTGKYLHSRPGESSGKYLGI